LRDPARRLSFRFSGIRRPKNGCMGIRKKYKIRMKALFFLLFIAFLFMALFPAGPEKQRFRLTFIEA
jgi:hypothetical protein